MGLLSFFVFLFGSSNSFIADYSFFATISLGILAIVTIIFGFADIKKQMNDDIDREVEKHFTKIKDKKIKDFIDLTVKNVKISLKTQLKNIGWWFGICIYTNLLLLALTIISQYHRCWIFDIIINGILLFSILVIIFSIFYLKKIIYLDPEEVIGRMEKNMERAEVLQGDLPSLYNVVASGAIVLPISKNI
jgi:hypothetical protein